MDTRNMIAKILVVIGFIGIFCAMMIGCFTYIFDLGEIYRYLSYGYIGFVPMVIGLFMLK